MEARILLFWRPSPGVRLSAQEIARELMWGEEVEGLIDLPIRDILDRLKLEFPRHREQSGLLACHAAEGAFEASWTWQYLRVEHRDLPPDQRERLIDIVESFECMAYEHQGR